MSGPQSTQSAGPVRFLIFCSISISLLASLVAGRRPQCAASAPQQGMNSIIPVHWNIKSAPASPGRSRVGPALYVFSLLGLDSRFCTVHTYRIRCTVFVFCRRIMCSETSRSQLRLSLVGHRFFCVFFTLNLDCGSWTLDS